MQKRRGEKCVRRKVHLPLKGRFVLGDLIANLHRPGVAAAVLTTIDPALLARIEEHAAAESMTPAEFVAGAVREFVERGEDDLWFQLLTVIRKADDPTLATIETIMRWVVTPRADG
jgi:hypothetical protein